MPDCEAESAAALSSLISVGAMLCVSEPERAAAELCLLGNLRNPRRLWRELESAVLLGVRARPGN